MDLYKLKQNGKTRQAAMSFNRRFEKMPAKSSFNWPVLIMDKRNAGVPQGSILGHLLLLIYINNLLKSLQSNPKVFTEDTFLSTSTVSLNHDLSKIFQWAVKFIAPLL